MLGEAQTPKISVVSEGLKSPQPVTNTPLTCFLTHSGGQTYTTYTLNYNPSQRDASLNIWPARADQGLGRLL